MPLLEARITLQPRFRELRQEVGLEPRSQVEIGVKMELVIGLRIKVRQELNATICFLLAPLLSTFASEYYNP